MAAGWVPGDDLSVDKGFVRQLFQSFRDRVVSSTEIVIVARAKIKHASGLERQSAIAVDLELVQPVWPFGQSRRPQGSVNLALTFGNAIADPTRGSRRLVLRKLGQ
jgi:hypothetical protein